MGSNIVLVRDNSDAGAQASALLHRHGIEHVVIYGNPDDQLPFVEDQEQHEVYVGPDGIRKFVQRYVRSLKINGTTEINGAGADNQAAGLSPS